MFNDLSADVLEVMRELEVRDEHDRDDGTPHLERLRQITPDTVGSSPCGPRRPRPAP
jgi:hypothetical protein